MFEGYLDQIKNDQKRVKITKLRLSNHKLEIEIGRHKKIERNNRLCRLCTMNAIEDECHFIEQCPRYNLIRRRYPSITLLKMKELFITNDTNGLLEMANFITELCEKRETLIK